MSDQTTTPTPETKAPELAMPFERNKTTVVFTNLKNRRTNTVYLAPKKSEMDKLVDFLGPTIINAWVYSKYRQQCIEYTKLSTKDGEFDPEAFKLFVDKGAIVKLTLGDLRDQADDLYVQLLEYSEKDLSDEKVRTEFTELTQHIKDINKQIAEKEASRAAKRAANANAEDDED